MGHPPHIFLPSKQSATKQSQTPQYQPTFDVFSISMTKKQIATVACSISIFHFFCPLATKILMLVPPLITPFLLSDAQIQTRDTRTCAILILAWGSIWGSSGVSHNQINHGSSGACVTLMYCGLSVKNKQAQKCGTVREDHERICFAFIFACVVGKNPKTPKSSPWLTTPLHRMVQVFYLWCISVV